MALVGPCMVCMSFWPGHPEYRSVNTFHRANYGYKKEFVCAQCMEHVESSRGSEASSQWWSTEDDDGEAESDGADSDGSHSIGIPISENGLATEMVVAPSAYSGD